MDTISFAIIGTGMVAEYHKTAILHNQATGAHLAAVCHHDPLQFDDISNRFGVPCYLLEDLLDQHSIDAVCVCTPSGLHAEQAIAALRKNKHVLVEKPMALSVSDATSMIGIAKERNVALGVALQRRAAPLFKEVYDAIEQGDLGELTMASIVMPYFRDQAYYDQADWRGTWALDGGGVLMNQGIHIVDLLLWYMGDPVEIKAFSDTLHRNIEVEDTLAASLRFSNGAFATLVATTTVGGGAPHRIELYGTKGAIQIEGERIVRWNLESQHKDLKRPSSTSDLPTGGAGSDPRGISTDGHTALIADFLEAIRHHRQPIIDGTEGMRSLSVVHDIYRAAGIVVPG